LLPDQIESFKGRSHMIVNTYIETFKIT